MVRSVVARVAVPLIIFALALSGCSALAPIFSGGAAQMRGSAVTPVVGDCWRATYEMIEVDSSWRSGRPVDCATTHESYTYAVVTISKSFTGALIDERTDSVRDDIDQAAGSDCMAATKRFLPTATLNESRLQLGYFVPSAAAWEKGARWVRCDVALIAYGSRLAAPKLASLPKTISDFVHTAKTKPEWIALCIDTGAKAMSTDPLNAPTATYADCAGTPQWREVSESTLPGGSDAPFPNDYERAQYAHVLCGDAAKALNRVWFAYQPSEKSWSLGSRTLECWVAADESGVAA